jgi:hypothetical protein
MSQDRDVFNESTLVIEEIEGQLNKILQKKIGDIDQDLEAKILQAREEADRRREAVEKDIGKEKSAIAEYRNLIREAEAERAALVGDIREHFKKILHLQQEIEGLAKATADEIRVVNEIQGKLEETRHRTAERAAFLKNDLRERFGIVADVPEEKGEPLQMDLELELEKLRKIKELLALESAAKTILEPADGESPREHAQPHNGEDPDRFKIPAIRELIESAEPSEKAGGPEALSSPAEVPAAPKGEARPGSGEEVEAFLDSCRKSEPSDGWGEVEYFQKGEKAIIDGERLMATVDKILDESTRLIERLGQTESPKDQFFIKQELVNFQEGLRALFLRIVKMSEKGSWSLSRFTRDVFNVQSLRLFLERLSMENWSNAEEFRLFSESVREFQAAFRTKIEPRADFLRSLKDEIESS